MNGVLEQDARAMITAMSEISTMKSDVVRSKYRLMDRLCDIVGAKAWAWALDCNSVDRPQYTRVGILQSGFDDDEFAQVVTTIEQASMTESNRSFLRSVASSPKSEAKIQDGSQWGNVGVGSVIMYGRPLGRFSMSTVLVFRGVDEPPFGERENNIMEIMLDGVGWLHENSWPHGGEERVTQFSKRQRMVLNLLLNGKGRKQISGDLGITENTVSGYVKEVYKMLGVCSHVDLIKNFMSGRVC